MLVIPFTELPIFFNISNQSFGLGGDRSDRDRGHFKYNKKPPHCTYCGRDNHTVDKCNCKHGFPIGFHESSSYGSVN